jgi:flagellar operon protein
MNNINAINQLNILPKTGVNSQNSVKNNPAVKENISLSFKDIFAGKIASGGLLEEMKMSKHAAERMNSRNISFTEKELQSLGDAIKKAEDKGSKESLILLNDIALVVSVRNKTVITAMTCESLKENVVTNIDSTIIM